MMHPALFIQRGDGFCARQFTNGGADKTHGQARLNRAQQRFNERAAVVDFGNEAIGIP